MKVGILTFHRAHNYGAVLQCYALQEVLKGMGHEVEVIDYKQPRIEDLYQTRFLTRSLVKNIITFNLSGFVKECKKYKNKVAKSKYFKNFLAKNIKTSREVEGRNIPQSYDRYIVGSDQMWSYQCVRSYEPVYWGQFKRDAKSKLFGYSISGNGDFFEKIDHNLLKQCINSFDNVSFRENTIKEYASRITGIDYPITVDPTLLTSKSTWNSLIKEKKSDKPYIVIYKARGYKSDPNFLFKRAKEFAEPRGMEVVDLNKSNVSVEDFVSFIYNADYVFTTSFHATAFAVIFNIPFFSFVLSDGHDSRYVELVNSLELNDRLIKPDEAFHQINILTDDEMSCRIEKMRVSSFEYLNNIVNG